jgi:hypothetical protein
MESVMSFLLGIGGLVVLTGFVIMFVAGWWILASRSKKMKEIT